MITAHGYFDDCINLARQHGFTRIEVSNIYMRGNTLQFRNRLEAALEDCDVAGALARKVGDQRAEMVAEGGGKGWVYYDMGRTGEAFTHSETGLDLARAISAGRFEAMILVWLAKLRALDGQSAEAVRLAEEAVAIARDSSIAFTGPMALSALALVTDDDEQRREALAEGERILQERCVSHNYLYFYRDAIEVSLQDRAWDEVERYAAALEAYTAEEPLPWTDIFIARGRALAAHGQGLRDAALTAELERLRDEIVESGHGLALSAVEAALAET
jgi:tetratricopeptide (TPR) repeat protein